jgi:hypothetical protein
MFSTKSQTLALSVVAALVSLGVVAYVYSSFKKSSKAQKPKSSSKLLLPVVDLQSYFQKEKDPETYLKETAKVAEALHKFGVCVVRDPRVVEADNDAFLQMMERYFESSDGKRDARPEAAFQMGVTPANTGNVIFPLCCLMDDCPSRASSESL